MLVTIIPGTVALCLKDNRGNSIKWPWMVHSCRSTLFLTGLTDQSAPGREARAPTHRGFLSPLRHSTEFLFDRGRAQRRNRDAKVNYLAYIRMPPRVRIDLLFSSAGPLSFVPVSNVSRMVFHPRRTELVSKGEIYVSSNRNNWLLLLIEIFVAKSWNS